MLTQFSRNSSLILLVIMVFGIVALLFAGHHAVSSLEKGDASHHQFDAYYCLFAICVAVISAATLIIVFLSRHTVRTTIASTGLHIFFPPEKPPRG